MAENPVETLKTLIVDDEPLAVERMQVICAKIPAIQVVGTASDGAQALRLVDALKPDLILLDMTMPEVDGISVAKSLAKQTERPAVVFVTAHDNYAVEAFDLDAVDYVLKPVKPERLERAVSRDIDYSFPDIQDIPALVESWEASQDNTSHTARESE